MVETVLIRMLALQKNFTASIAAVGAEPERIVHEERKSRERKQSRDQGVARPA